MSLKTPAFYVHGLEEIKTYMESRKMVLMVVFSGQQRRNRNKEQTFDHGGGHKGWEDLRE